jgi:hypothetical protein
VELDDLENGLLDLVDEKCLGSGGFSKISLE